MVTKKQAESKKAAQKKAPKKELKKVEPARALEPFDFDEIERLFDQFMSRGWLRSPRFDWPLFPRSVLPFEGNVPNVDVIERDDALVVKAELPGVDKEDLDVSLSHNTVTIKGSTSHEEKEEEGNYYRCEISQGSYSRTIALPSEVDETNAKANFKDGILELTLPKLKQSKRHSVKVE